MEKWGEDGEHFRQKEQQVQRPFCLLMTCSYKELGSYFYLSESISGGSTAGLARDMERAHQDRLYVETWVESKKKEEARVFEFMSV